MSPFSSPAFFSFHTRNQALPQLTNLTGTTETRAVNAMLSAIGEAPIETLDDAVGRTDVDMAVNHLRDATVECLTEGWKFNTEWGLAVSAVTDTLEWTDPDGEVKTLSVFLPPTGLIEWSLSKTREQVSLGLDVTLRPSKVYNPGTVVFYDRENNRDGFEDLTLLWIDAKFLFDWDDCPEVFRNYVKIVAGRRFIADMLGDVELAGFRQRDEVRALRSLRRAQGETDNANILDHPESALFLGGRPRGYKYARPSTGNTSSGSGIGSGDWIL